MRTFKIAKHTLGLLSIIALNSCITSPQQYDVSKIVAERDSAIAESQRKGHELEELNILVSTIAESIDSITHQEGVIRMQRENGAQTSREELRQSITDLSNIVLRQKQRIAELQSKYNNNASEEVQKMQSIVEYLNEQLDAKEALIEKLQRELTNKNGNIAQLENEISELTDNVAKLTRKTEMQKQILSTQSEMMNECYMKIGTTKALKQVGILDGKKINPQALVPEKFVRVDIRELRELNINAKKPKILTAMPQGSYALIQNSDNTTTLKILDPTRFWSVSNYLVITTN